MIMVTKIVMLCTAIVKIESTSVPFVRTAAEHTKRASRMGGHVLWQWSSSYNIRTLHTRPSKGLMLRLYNSHNGTKNDTNKLFLLRKRSNDCIGTKKANPEIGTYLVDMTLRLVD